jgi:dTDP-glucose 4,6-dehydratase
LKTFFDVHQFPVVTTRAANVYGEGQQLYRIIPKTILSILMGLKLPLHGGGHSERSFIHMDDVSNATKLIGERGVIGSCYHISTKQTVSIRDLIKQICQLMSVSFDDVCEVTEDRPGKDAAYLLNSERLRSEFDWQEVVDLTRGLERVIEWAKNNVETLQQQPLEYIHKV